MADELENQNTEIESQEQEHVEQTPQLSAVEQKAMEQGWVPQDEWTGDPDAWRPAKEFVDRGELFKKIDEVRRENKNLKTAIEEFGKHHAKVKEMEFKRALATLKAAKKEALAENDVDAVVEIDERMDEVKETYRAEQAAPQVDDSQPDPRFLAWVNKNQWYQTDRAMKAVADEVARDLVVNGERDNNVILNAVEKTVRKEFPHKFNNPNRERAGAVEGSTPKAPSRNKSDDVQMTEAEKRIMEKIVRSGAITREKYLEEYKATKG